MKTSAEAIRGWALIAAECRAKAAQVQGAVDVVRDVTGKSDRREDVLTLLKRERDQYDSLANEHEKLVREALEDDA